MDGPLAGAGDTFSYTYNSDGFLASIENEVGHTITITSWSGSGQPTTIVDPNGVTSTVAYDYADRVVEFVVAPGVGQSTYEFEYDPAGNLTKLTLPEGGWLAYDYDAANRLTRISNNRGQERVLTVNAVGEPTTLTTSSASSIVTQQQARAYDELGRLIAVTGAGSQSTAFGYDKVGNVTSITDARGKLFSQTYDALNRVSTQTDPNGAVVELAYTPTDVLTQLEDARDNETSRIVDGFGLVIQELSPDRGTSTYWYDAASNLTRMINGDGQEALFAYDDASRLTAVTYTGSSADNAAFSYDSTASGNYGIGRLTSVDEADVDTAFVYDARGRLTRDTKVIEGKTYVTEYGYDQNGAVTTITLPSGRIIAFDRAIDGLATAVSTQTSTTGPSTFVASEIEFLPFGPLAGLTYGNGLELVRSYDQNMWLGGIDVADGSTVRLDLAFGRNANGQLTSVTDGLGGGRSAVFTYTDAGRLETANGVWGADTYSYDATGNLEGWDRVLGGSTTASDMIISPTSNHLVEVEDSGGATVRDLSYLPGGDLSEDARAGGGTYTYEYNARRRLSHVELNGVDVASFGYDFRGNRVSRTLHGVSPTSSHFIFDANGHLLAEHDGATGSVLREYVWLGEILLAIVDHAASSPTLLYVHTGQIDEPLAVTNAAQQLVWSAAIEPYGQAHLLASPSAEIDLRLPGQWVEVALASLHQNWFRTYDPSLGRYIEADPLGIAAGQNLYVYVDGDPLNRVDPEGRFVLFVPLIGGVYGGAVAGVINLGVQYAGGEAFNPSSFGSAVASGALSGALLVSPLGASRWAPVVIGGLTAFAFEAFDECVTPGSLLSATFYGVVGGAIVGPTRRVLAGGRPLPMHVTDWRYVGPTVLPTTVLQITRVGVGGTVSAQGGN
ncbi:RHS repeat-associated core domain-containing protein [Phenylobacterium sp.]|uniref:RHS repeat-associated core domain-containing protein n=1 Tax=Phenylobacterium sp. TaxID=1871053 RepID=UPI0026386034|nr:RHS repeat-associated core domain-containing protein [Phenylobacterium sp.]